MLVTKGRVLAQRFYDVAEEVDLPRAAALLRAGSRRPTFVRSARQLRMPSPPLELSVGTRNLFIASLPPVDVLVRIYDVGAVAVTFAWDLPCPIGGDELLAYSSRLLGGEDLFVAPGRVIADELLDTIRPACRIRNVSDVTEEYTIFMVTATDPPTDADRLTEELDVARLLIGETGPISRRERQQQSHGIISYSPSELVVVDWNSALVYDPSGSSDLTDLLELASMQLLELRAYDDIVGRSLARYYDDLGKPERSFRSSHDTRLSREILRLFVDVNEMTDRIEHSLTILGDSWLARLHRAALKEFEVLHWSQLVKEKLEVLRQINEQLVDQITARKSYGLEMSIVVLIVVELAVALFRLG